MHLIRLCRPFIQIKLELCMYALDMRTFYMHIFLVSYSREAETSLIS